AAVGSGARQLIRWSDGVDCEAGFLGEGCIAGGSGEGGFVRAFLTPGGTWGTYLYTSYPRAAFEVIAVPEPASVTLCASGLVALALRRMGQKVRRWNSP